MFINFMNCKILKATMCLFVTLLAAPWYRLYLQFVPPSLAGTATGHWTDWFGRESARVLSFSRVMETAASLSPINDIIFINHWNKC